MNRRDVITRACAAAVCAVFPAGHAISAATVELGTPSLHLTRRLRLTCAWPQAAGGTFDAALAIARAIEIAVDGCTVDVSSGDAAAAIADGDIAFGTESAHSAQDPALALIAGLPGRFALHPDDAAHWLNGPGQDLWREAALRSGPAIPLYAGCEGLRPALWSRREIASLAGFKVAGAGGLAAALLSAAGATPVEMPPEAWAEALDGDAIDAVHVASLEDALTLGLQHRAKHVMPAALAAHGGPLTLRIPAQVWDAWPSQQQQRLHVALAKAGQFRETRASQSHAALIAAMTQSAALQVQTAMPLNLQRTLDRLSEAIVADYSSRDALCRKIGGASMAPHLLSCTSPASFKKHLNVV